MTKEHKKLYKAGKNWIVATLTATTITLLGGIGAYTVHADTTIESSQDVQTTSVNQTNQTVPSSATAAADTSNSDSLASNIYGTVQSSQNNNSNNSVVLNQPVTTQSNPTVQSTQFTQGNQVTQNYQNTSTVATSNVSINDSDELDPSSLWYKPPFGISDDEVARSGLGDLDLHISDGINSNIAIYISFLDSTDEPEIQKYAHKEVTRDIYIKDPQTGVESFDRRDLVAFNRWVAVDTTRNNQLVGLGPWVLSLTSPKSFPKYNIPQKNGYTSYCNGKKATMIDEEQVSGNQPDEIYHITYVPTSSLVDKKTRTIIIKFPDRKQESTIQNTVLSGNSTCIWPKYVIPARDGYDSYVDGLKASVVPEQTVDVNDDDNVIVNVTYKMSTWGATHKRITRTIYIHDIDGIVSAIPQAVVYTRYAISNMQGNLVSYTNWVADGNSSWNEYAIPQHEGFISQIGSEDTKVVPSQLVNPNDEDTIVNVTYKKTPVTPSKDKHKAITRTIKIAYPSGYVQTISQTVNYTYHTVKIGSEVLAGWVADGNDSWDEYAIPQHDGFISQVDSQDAKIVPSQHVNPNDKDVDVSVTYIKTDSSKGNGNGDDNNNPSRLNTGTINYIDPDGKVVKTDQISGKVGDKVDVKISLPDGYELANKDEHIPSSITVGEDGIKTITIQVKKLPVVQTGSINYVDQDGKVIKTDTISGKVGDQINVNLSLPDGYELANKDEHIPSVITVTENGIGTINVNVKKINTTLANNEVPYDSTTISNNVNANYGYLDSYKLTENNQGQAQLIASGWHATGASNSDRYRYMIVFDNTLGHEIARQKLVPQVRSDVQRAYPNVDNCLYSGFNITIDIPNSSINHSLSLIARYSNDPNNGEGARVDYWFNPLALNEGNQACLDGLSSNGNTLTVTGWHATNQAAGRPYHYIIAWDQNLGHEIARQKVTAVSRPDVANAYSTVANAVNSGFSVKFNLTPQFFNDNIQFISRWTDDAAGNGNAVDYWFKPMNRTNRANLDSVTLSNGQVKVAGWHATDLSQLEPNHYLIVFDNTTGQQVASEKVGLQSSQDVKNVFGDVQTANHSRFNYAFNSLHLISGHNYSLVSRYSADANGNGNDGAHTDSWLNMGTFQQSAYSIDHVALNRRHMTVQGWVANDNAMTKPYAYAILLQNGREIGRQRLTLSERDDVAKVYPQIYRSQYSGFNANFDLPTFSTRGLQLVLRFTDDPAGNGNSSDKWINL